MGIKAILFVIRTHIIIIIQEHYNKYKNIMKKKFICTVCGYIHEGTEAPAECPVCHAKAAKFKEFNPEALKVRKTEQNR